MLSKLITLAALLASSQVNGFEVEVNGEVSNYFCIMHTPSGLYLNTGKDENGANILELKKIEDSKD